jgi:hypothetical protein
MNRIEHLVTLGARLKELTPNSDIVSTAYAHNNWFVPEFVTYAIHAIANEMLSEKRLNEWLKQYQLQDINKSVGLIFAGNIPLAGFHDFLCCYVFGADMRIKLSSKDKVLFPHILSLLAETDSSVLQKVQIVDKLENFDAVIATGSDNSNRYFEYYFKKYPSILRRNRNSVAILNGEETTADLEALANDVFLYFGMGCRSVSKVYIPEGYDVRKLFPPFETYKWMFNHTAYMNNYDYKRTLFLLNSAPHLASNFLMIAESTQLASPISVLHYEVYKNTSALNERIASQSDNIQCIVSKDAIYPGSIPYGHSQHPELWDYADGADTIKFLIGLG